MNQYRRYGRDCRAIRDWGQICMFNGIIEHTIDTNWTTKSTDLFIALN